MDATQPSNSFSPRPMTRIPTTVSMTASPPISMISLSRQPSALKLLRPPKQEVDREMEDLEKDRSATWLELYYDIFYVACLRTLSHALTAGTINAGMFLSSFVVIWWSWLLVATYNTKYDTDGVFTRLGKLVQMFGVGAYSLSIERAMLEDLSSVLFVAGFMVVRFVLLVNYGTVLYYAWKRKKHRRRSAQTFIQMNLIPPTPLDEGESARSQSDIPLTLDSPNSSVQTSSQNFDPSFKLTLFFTFIHFFALFISLINVCLPIKPMDRWYFFIVILVVDAAVMLYASFTGGTPKQKVNNSDETIDIYSSDSSQNQLLGVPSSSTAAVDYASILPRFNQGGRTSIDQPSIQMPRPSSTAKFPLFRGSHLPERLGLFTIIVLGESVIAVFEESSSILGKAPSYFDSYLPNQLVSLFKRGAQADSKMAYYENAVLNLIVLDFLFVIHIFSHWYTYFDSFTTHLRRGGALLKPLWIYVHIIGHSLIALLGCVWVIVIKTVCIKNWSEPGDWALGIILVNALLGVFYAVFKAIMCYACDYVRLDKFDRLSIGTRLLGSIVMLLLLLIPSKSYEADTGQLAPLSYLMLGLTLMACVQWCIDLYVFRNKADHKSRRNLSQDPSLTQSTSPLPTATPLNTNSIRVVGSEPLKNIE